MKKAFSLALALLLCLSLIPATVNAAEASAKLTGPSVVRAGQTITLTFSLAGESLIGGQGLITYDSAQLDLIGTKPVITGNWDVKFNGNIFAIENTDQDSPITSSTKIFTVTFLVKQLEAGTKLNIGITGILATDSNYEEHNIGTATYSVNIAPPLSSDNTLKNLTVTNGTLVPEFDPSVTNYTVDVPFSVSKLDMVVEAPDGATLSIYDPTLTPDATTMYTITVTAANGAKKTYVINVTREQDPNYVPSANNFLSGIQVKDFFISPYFDRNVTTYLVWLPYETEKITVTATAQDKKASVRVEGGSGLVAGEDNVVQIICTAENGEEKIYTIIAKRAAPHGEIVVPPPTTNPVVPPDTQPSPTDPTGPVQTTPPTTSGENTPPSSGSQQPPEPVKDDGNIVLLVIYFMILLVALCGIIVCLVFIIGMRKKK